MSHNLEYLPWLRRKRRLMAAVTVVALAVLFGAEFVYSGLSEVPMFSITQAYLSEIMPWLDMACGVVAIASGFALASTWASRDWWAERWARSHEIFVGERTSPPPSLPEIPRARTRAKWAGMGASQPADSAFVAFSAPIGARSTSQDRQQCWHFDLGEGMRKQLLLASLMALSITPAATLAGSAAVRPNPLNDPGAVVSKCNADGDKAGCSIVALINRANVIYAGSVASISLDLTEIDLGGSLAKEAKPRLQEEFRRGFDMAPITRLLDEADQLALGSSAKALVARHREVMMGCYSTTSPSRETTKDRDAYTKLTKACEARAARSLDAIARLLKQPTSLPQFDFRKSRWGDSPEAVMVTEGKPVHQTPNSLVFESSVADLKAMAVYHFADGRLTDAGYVIEEAHTDHDRYASDFKTVTEGPTAKYGKAAYSIVQTDDEALKASPKRWGQGIALGELALRDDWESPVTSVDHLIASDNFKVSHIVRYESHEFALEREKSKAAAKMSGL